MNSYVCRSFFKVNIFEFKIQRTISQASNHQQLALFSPISESFSKSITMSDSESDGNLSDLEAQQDENEDNNSGDDTDKPELKGILDDVEETEVSWKDLVSYEKARGKTKKSLWNILKGPNRRSLRSVSRPEMESAVEDPTGVDPCGAERKRHHRIG